MDREDWVLVGAVILFIAFVVGTIIVDSNRDSENFVDLSLCAIIGSAADRGHGNDVVYRKIYKCPDGMIHIR